MGLERIELSTPRASVVCSPTELQSHRYQKNLPFLRFQNPQIILSKSTNNIYKTKKLKQNMINEVNDKIRHMNVWDMAHLKLVIFFFTIFVASFFTSQFLLESRWPSFVVFAVLYIFMILNLFRKNKKHQSKTSKKKR